MDQPIPLAMDAPGAGSGRLPPFHTSALTRSILEAPSIVDILAERAATEAGAALRFLADGEGDAHDWTFQQLQAAAAHIAAVLRSDGRAGERVVLALEPGLDFVAGLFGTLQAGRVAVPCFSPVGSRAIHRLRSVVVDSRPGAVLAAERMLPRINQMTQAVGPNIRTIAYRSASDLAPSDLYPIPRASDLAIVQYTSGSTSHPRGVALSHANLMSNCRTLLDRMGWQPDRIGCSWLPPYHDLGLLGAIIISVFGGWPLVMLTPGHFAQRPFRWLKAMSDHRATVTVAPVSALDICVDGIGDEELDQLDLSCLRQIYCGAEPIHASTIERFSRRFAGRGLTDTAVSPCYGLAEATLHVTAKPDRTAPRVLRVDRSRLEAGSAIAGSSAAARDAAVEIVSCGVPAKGHDVVVVDIETCLPVPDGIIGEIWVAGPNVAAGYFDVTTSDAVAGQRFGARLRGEPEAYLCTGDLGFIHDGELFVTGRAKEVVVVFGRNLYPYDVERAAMLAHAGLRAAVAFGVGGDRGPERLVVVGELRCRTSPGADILGGIRRAVTAAVSTATGVAPVDVRLGPVGTISTTTSGKVRRLATRHGYLEHSLRAFPPAAPDRPMIAEGRR